MCEHLRAQIALGALAWAGYYPAAPERTERPEADEALLEGLRAFQRDFGLKQDALMRPGGETQTTLDALITPLVRQAQALAQQAASEGDDIAYAPPDEPPPRQPGPADPPPAEDPPQPPAEEEPDEEPPEDEEPPDQEPEPDEEDEEEREERCVRINLALFEVRRKLE